jgi:hypothetical protein
MSSMMSIQLDTCVICLFALGSSSGAATYLGEEWVVIGEGIHLFVVVAGPADIQHRLNVRVDEPGNMMRR